MSRAEPRFIVDYMLGRLARWLLLLGYDTVYVSSGEQPDEEAMAQAAREDRVFLTRDTKIPSVAGVAKIVLKGQRLEDQIVQVFRELDRKPDPRRFFTRCTLCNVPVEGVPREEALPQVPEKVRDLETGFWRCPSCRKLYWAGTHVENTLKKLQSILAG